MIASACVLMNGFLNWSTCALYRIRLFQHRRPADRWRRVSLSMRVIWTLVHSQFRFPWHSLAIPLRMITIPITKLVTVPPVMARNPLMHRLRPAETNGLTREMLAVPVVAAEALVLITSPLMTSTAAMYRHTTNRPMVSAREHCSILFRF